MNVEILKNNKLSVPVNYIATKGFVEGTSYVLEEYIALLEDCEVDSNIVSRILKFKEKYRLCIQNYLKGKHSLAYRNFEQSIEELGLDFGEFVTNLDTDVFYRARINTTSYQYSASEMFHIGLDKRTLVKTERYSFPGLPCLYLGASSYACWVEMDCPRMEEFQVALLKKKDKKNVQVIDLSLLPEKEYEAIKAGSEKISLERYILLWPLIAMCSVKVNKEEDPFKPEYIFPQFVLEYALADRKDEDKHADGIKYASIKVSNISDYNYKDDESTYACYVFPVKSEKDILANVDDNLSAIFKIESTYSGRMLQVLTDTVRDYDFNDIDENNDRCEWIYTDKKRIRYKDTIFHRIEKVLSGNAENNGRKIFNEPPEEWTTNSRIEDELFLDKREKKK